MANRHDQQSFSESGTATILAATGAVTGVNLCAIQCIEDTVFSVLTDKAERSGYASSVTGRTYPAGFALYGQFTALTVTSGAVRVTFASPVA